jgi:hypothetical protein
MLNNFQSNLQVIIDFIRFLYFSLLSGQPLFLSFHFISILILLIHVILINSLILFSELKVILKKKINLFNNL